MSKKQPTADQLKEDRLKENELDEKNKKKAQKLLNDILPIRYDDIIEVNKAYNGNLKDNILNYLSSKPSHLKFQILKMFIDDKMVKCLIGQVNSNLEKDRDKFSKEQNDKDMHHYNDMDEDDLWRVLLKLWSESLKTLQTIKDMSKRLDTILNNNHPIGKNRYSILHSRLKLSEGYFDEFTNIFASNSHNVFEVGTVSAVDESVTQYYGRDARRENSLVDISNKPHSVGVMSYSIVQRLGNSNLPIVLGFIPKILKFKDVPIKMCLSLIEQFRKFSSKEQILICDSAFSLHKNKTSLEKLNCTFIGSTRSTGTTLMHQVKSLVVDQLNSTNSMLFYYQTNKTIIEYCQGQKDNNEFTNIMVTNNYEPIQFGNTSNKDEIVSDDCFVSFGNSVYLCDEWYIKTYNLKDAPENKIKYIKEHHNVDLLKPPSNNGWRLDLLDKLDLRHLKLLYKEIIGATTKTPKKETIINAILENQEHLKTRLNSRPNSTKFDSEKDYTKLDIVHLKRSILEGPIENQPRIHDRYLYNYNLIDQVDQKYYRSMRGSSAGNYITLEIQFCLFECIVNAHSVYSEFNGTIIEDLKVNLNTTVMLKVSIYS
ncbi:hypothetical protein ACTFIW_005183 [Dictyostelium discoideum]